MNNNNNEKNKGGAVVVVVGEIERLKVHSFSIREYRKDEEEKRREE